MSLSSLSDLLDHHLPTRPEPRGLDHSETSPNARTNRIAAIAYRARQQRLACLLLLEGNGWQRFLAQRGSCRDCPEGIETAGPHRRAGPRSISISLARSLRTQWEALPPSPDLRERVGHAAAAAVSVVQQVDATVLLLTAAEALAAPPPETPEEQELRAVLHTAAEDLSALHARWVLANRPLVCHLVQRHKSLTSQPGISLEDCIQEGMMGLGTAAAKFNLAAKAAFSTYATYWVMQQVRRYLDNCERFIRIPVNRVQLWNRVRRYRDEHPKATSEEVSRALRIPLVIARELLEVPEVIRLASVEEEACSYDVDAGGPQRRIPSATTSPEPNHALRGALARQNPTDRLLVGLHFDLDDLGPVAGTFIQDWQQGSHDWLAARLLDWEGRCHPPTTHPSATAKACP